MSGFVPIANRSLGGLKQTAKNLYWRTYGYFLANPSVPRSPKSLLFVCKGNICRSPFAEALAQRNVPEGMRMTCRSAGITVREPEGCPRETVVAAERFGIDLSGHRSRRIDQGLVDGSDMVFAMETWQFVRLRKNFPRHAEKMFLLPLFDTNRPARSDAYGFFNIRDPYGRSIGDFLDCFERIDTCLEGVFSAIRGIGLMSQGEEAEQVVGNVNR